MIRATFCAFGLAALAVSLLWSLDSQTDRRGERSRTRPATLSALDVASASVRNGPIYMVTEDSRTERFCLDCRERFRARQGRLAAPFRRFSAPLRHLRGFKPGVPPLISPDGQHVLYAVLSSPADASAWQFAPWDLIASNVDWKHQQLVGEPQTLLKAVRYPELLDYAWSPDSRSIAILTDSNRRPALSIVDLAGTPIRRLPTGCARTLGTVPVAPIESPLLTWSRTNSIAFVAGYRRTENTAIYTVSAEGSEPCRLMFSRPRAAQDFGPAWSPGGRRLAFVRWGVNRTDALMTVVRSRGRPRRLRLRSPNDKSPRSLAWSPDGRWMAFLPESTNGIWIVRAGGGRVRVVSVPTKIARDESVRRLNWAPATPDG